MLLEHLYRYMAALAGLVTLVTVWCCQETLGLALHGVACSSPLMSTLAQRVLSTVWMHTAKQ